ncbi:hypothetical protein SE17_10985 [Kouleothrix aurantiaca]|uniref:DUF4386 domain-containing protein n=1 Tax=Kouleothrix aurantiaca TaxID=186479 RepID=A0A0P9F9B0_9CHLR|nr:hypothetical protein SE17_10985 [Kouleothrix aurantiaca]
MNTTTQRSYGADRTAATLVGILYIIGTVAGALSLPLLGGIPGAPDYLTIVAANPSRVVLGALLILIMGLALAVIPALMFPILKRWNEALAIGYVIFRGALETFTYLALVLCWLLLIVVAQQAAGSAAVAASQFGNLGLLVVKAHEPIAAVVAIVFSLGALILYSLLYYARLVPCWISGWGLVAAVLYLASGLAAMFGLDLGMLQLLMLVQEMVMAVWLIAKGFSASAIAPGPTKSAISGPLGAA